MGPGTALDPLDREFLGQSILLIRDAGETWDLAVSLTLTVEHQALIISGHPGPLPEGRGPLPPFLVLPLHLAKVACGKGTQGTDDSSTCS